MDCAGVFYKGTMTIDDQITLFYRKIRETAANSAIDTAEALDRLNGGRRRVALATRFFKYSINFTAAGGESQFALDADFQPAEVRDWASVDGNPVTIKDKASWVTDTNGVIVAVLSPWERWAMLDGAAVYVFPLAQAGEVWTFQGSGIPPKLTGITGPDPYLNEDQAEAAVLDAAMETLEDQQKAIGPVLADQHKRAMDRVRKAAKLGNGPRLENAPGML
jgi:hypothetical protein